MTWAAVAKKDFQDAARSRWLWALTALFVVLLGGVAYLYVYLFSNAPQNEVTGLMLVFFLISVTSWLIPIIGLMVGYKAIVGERESGSIKLLLGLPHSRRDAVLGKFVGRFAVVAVASLVGFAVTALIVLALYDQFDLVSYLQFIAITLLFALAYVAIAVGISAFTSTTSKALAAAVSVIAVFKFLWGTLLMVLYWATQRLQGESFDIFELATNPPDWYQFFNSLAPETAYQNAVVTLLPDDPRQMGPGQGGMSPDSAAAAAQQVDPFYLQNWFGFVILAVWIAVPLLLGYYRFRDADL